MIGKNVKGYSFRRKEQVMTLASKTAVQFSDGKVQVDPQLLFQMLSIVATSCGRYDNPRPFFHHEMYSFPPALFDSSLLPRKANKPVLADAIWSITKDSQTSGLLEVFNLSLMEVLCYIEYPGHVAWRIMPFSKFTSSM